MKRIFFFAVVFLLLGCETEQKSRYDIAFDNLMMSEGGYVNHPNDPGGETKYGICKASNPTIDIKNITPDFAKKYYRERFWSSMYDKINDQEIAIKLFDTSVNVGWEIARSIIDDTLIEVFLAENPELVCQFQLIIASCKKEKDFIPWENYVMNAINSMNSSLFLNIFRVKLSNYYLSIVRKNKKLSCFMTGWLMRALR